MAPRPSIPEAVIDALDRLADAVRQVAGGKKAPALIPVPVRRPGTRRG